MALCVYAALSQSCGNVMEEKVVKVTFGYRKLLCLQYRPERFLWIECGLRPESLYESGGERRDRKLIVKKWPKKAEMCWEPC